MFTSTNFIVQYTATDTALVFQDQYNRRIDSVNICKYLNSGVKENIIWVLLQGGIKSEFTFPTAQDATTAFIYLRTALDTLQPNCEIGGNSPSPTPVLEPVSITLANYKTLIANHTVVALQWYDITDTNGLFRRGTGQVFRCLALNNTDSFPQGIILTTDDKVILNMTSNQVIDETVVELNIVELNNSSVTNVNDTSDYIVATNGSTIIANGSNNILAQNSYLEVENCNNIVAFNNSSILIKNSLNCSFTGVGGDLTALGTFNDIVVDKASSLGKNGVILNNLPDLIDKTLLAYQDVMYQKFDGILGDNVILTLENIPLSDVNAEFTLFIEPTAELDNYTITIKNSNGNTLIVINSSYIGQEIKFKFGISPGEFFLLPIGSGGSSNKIKTNITVISNAQTLFSNVLASAPLNPSVSELVINGQVQLYGVDYTITSKNINWLSTDFSLVTTDIIFIITE